MLIVILEKSDFFSEHRTQDTEYRRKTAVLKGKKSIGAQGHRSAGVYGGNPCDGWAIN